MSGASMRLVPHPSPHPGPNLYPSYPVDPSGSLLGLGPEGRDGRREEGVREGGVGVGTPSKRGRSPLGEGC